MNGRGAVVRYDGGMNADLFSIGLPEIISIGLVLILLFWARILAIFGYEYRPRSLKGLGAVLVVVVFVVIILQLLDLFFSTH